MTNPSDPSPRGALMRALWRHRFERLLAEMAVGVAHSALSLALSERGEVACALLDRDGRTVAEYGAPLRAAAIGLQVRAALVGLAALTPGQVLAVSDPQAGGTDLGTITLIAVVPGSDGAPLGYLAVNSDRGDWAHPPAGPPASQTDLTVEALPLSTGEPGERGTSDTEELAALPPAVGPRYRGFHAAEAPSFAGPPRTREDEGGALTPTLLTDSGMYSLAQKQRDPIEALADLKAVRGALRTGAHYLRGLDKRHGSVALRAWMAQQLSDSQAAMQQALQRVPSGVYAFADSLDDDGRGARDLAIRATVHVTHENDCGRITLDFQESADAAAGNINTVPAVVHAAVRCALAALLPPGVAANDGLSAAVRLLLRPGSLLAAGQSHAVAAGATETALRLIDVVLGALSQALPQPIRAAGAGTSSWVTLRIPEDPPQHGSAAQRQRLYLREALAGGGGATPAACGATGRHTPTPSPRALPCELIEQRLPVRVLRCAVRPDSGGGGVRTGGDGLVRELLLLTDLHVELCGERRRRPPYGLAGGGPGQLGRDTLIRDDQTRLLPAKVRLLLRTGDLLRTESPGGGGYGDAMRAAFFATLLG